MELLYLLLLFTFFLVFIILSIDKSSKARTSNLRELPPGPWKLPIIGSIHHLAGKLTHQTLRDLANKHGPVMHLKLGDVDWVVITSPEAAREVSKTNDLNFASRPELLTTKIANYGSTGLAFSPYGAYWRQLRKICVVELLNSNRVRSFIPLMDEEVLNVVKEISAKTNQTVNFSEMIKSMANTIICRAVFSRACEDPKKFLKAAEELSRLSSGFILVDVFPSSKFIHAVSVHKVLLIERMHKRMDGMLDRIIEEHQAKGMASEDEDLVDVLLRIQESGDLEIPLTRDNIKAVILDMFFAGTDTTSSILEWVMTELCRNPQVMEKVQLELRQVLKAEKTKIEERDIGQLQYLKLIIKETLRLHPPVPLLLPRLCREACQVGGFTVPKGSRVAINVWAMGRDPSIWGDDAVSFRPERFSESTSIDFRGTSYEYLPFGAGRRMCPGIAFGLTSVELALARLLLHFDWRLPNGMKANDLDMIEDSGLTLKRKHDLILVAAPSNFASCLK